MKARASITSDKHTHFMMLKNNKNKQTHNASRTAEIQLFRPLYFLDNEFI
jgi:hypothetical protein